MPGRVSVVGSRCPLPGAGPERALAHRAPPARTGRTEMIHDAQVHLAGYVATEPRFKKVAGDTSSARLRVAYTARRRDKETGEWDDGPTSFVNDPVLADAGRQREHVRAQGRAGPDHGPPADQALRGRGGRAQDRRGGRGGVGRSRPDPWRGAVLAHPVARGDSGGRGCRPAGRCAWIREARCRGKARTSPTGWSPPSRRNGATTGAGAAPGAGDDRRACRGRVRQSDRHPGCGSSGAGQPGRMPCGRRAPARSRPPGQRAVPGDGVTGALAAGVPGQVVPGG